jgi:hypothetical protein
MVSHCYEIRAFKYFKPRRLLKSSQTPSTSTTPLAGTSALKSREEDVRLRFQNIKRQFGCLPHPVEFEHTGGESELLSSVLVTSPFKQDEVKRPVRWPLLVRSAGPNSTSKKRTIFLLTV